jgi:hypothetical protein
MFKNQFIILDDIQRNINLTLDMGGRAGAALRENENGKTEVVLWGDVDKGGSPYKFDSDGNRIESPIDLTDVKAISMSRNAGAALKTLKNR